VIARLNRRCDELGLDTMEIGGALAVAMEAGLLAFGDGEAALNLLDQVGKTVLGRVLGHGTAITGRVLGVRRVPVVKGQSLPAYDPRALKGTGLTYCTSPMGADHTAGNCLPGSALPDGAKPDPHSWERQAELSSYLQLLATAFDALGLCWFARAPLLADPTLLTDLLESFRGGSWSMERLLEEARRTLGTEHAYNKAAGFTPADDALPTFFYREMLPPLGLTFDATTQEAETLHRLGVCWSRV
jgi:aldehyde:ferredoxin oxidoreductase